jgi:hypothetical protein
MRSTELTLVIDSATRFAPARPRFPCALPCASIDSATRSFLPRFQASAILSAQRAGEELQPPPS